MTNIYLDIFHFHYVTLRNVLGIVSSFGWTKSLIYMKKE